MKAIKFEGSNSVLRGSRPDVDDLHTFKDGRHILSCWKGTWRDRLRYLLTGKMWLWVMAPVTQPPISMQTEAPFKK